MAREKLSLYANALRAAYGARDPSAEVLVKNWWRPSVDGPLSTELGEREARSIAARDHGFDAWSSVAGECDGVEIRCQIVPGNAPAVAALLIAAGADRTARLTAYGGSYDVLCLAVTPATSPTAPAAARGPSRSGT